jgi:sodium/potassium-transporting ATPase subunit alpha
LNGTIEFLQLQKSAKLLEGFMDMVPRNCRVIRQGNMNESQAAELVPGDIVFVKMGDKVPADLRIFHSTDMKVMDSVIS